MMKEYGTVETEHMGICKDCKEIKTVRLFLTNAQEEVTVCVECYMNS